jgi:hypothetical protein
LSILTVIMQEKVAYHSVSQHQGQGIKTLIRLHLVEVNGPHKPSFVLATLVTKAARNHNLNISKVPLECQVQSKSQFPSAASNQKGPQASLWWSRVEIRGDQSRQSSC